VALARVNSAVVRLKFASMFDYLAKYFWAIGLIFAAREHYSWVNKKDQVLSQQPELADSYDRVMWGHTVFYSLPWVVMGIGILSGRVGNVFDFLRPRSGNAFVLAFYFVIAMETLSLTGWVWAFGGASYLSPYMNKSPTSIKLWFALSTVFLIFWMGMAYMQPAAT